VPIAGILAWNCSVAAMQSGIGKQERRISKWWDANCVFLSLDRIQLM
jgi:hypothetical protein